MDSETEKETVFMRTGRSINFLDKPFPPHFKVYQKREVMQVDSKTEKKT